MKDFFTWFRETPAAAARPWCVLGKGPTFSRRGEFDLDAFNVLSLNHVVRELKVRVAHFMGLAACLACRDVLAGNADVVVMPRRPHVNNAPGARTLAEVAAGDATLSALAEADRLVWYNSSLVPPYGDSPVVPVEFFSAEAAIALLAMAGAHTVRSLGVDGGDAYAREFADLSATTRLANRRASFDKQFAAIARVIRGTGVTYGPLTLETPVRVYVATTEAQMLAVKLLEYSIRKHASIAVDVVPLNETGIEIPLPEDPARRPRTPFSFQRFLIPQAAGYRGRAVYLDSDMQVFRDIRELWSLPMDGADLLAAREPGGSGRRPQFSVMVLDCAALGWDIAAIVRRLDAGDLTYEQLMGEMRVARSIRPDIDPSWNSLERYEAGVTGLVHYTDMPTQPWVASGNPLGYLWVRDLIEAVDAAVIPLAYVREHILRGWVRPSLEWQIVNRVEDGLLLPRQARRLDRAFQPPWIELGAAPSPLVGARRRVAAMVRQAWLRSPLPSLTHRVRERFFPE